MGRTLLLPCVSAAFRGGDSACVLCFRCLLPCVCAAFRSSDTAVALCFRCLRGGDSALPSCPSAVFRGLDTALDLRFRCARLHADRRFCEGGGQGVLWQRRSRLPRRPATDNLLRRLRDHHPPVHRRVRRHPDGYFGARRSVPAEHDAGVVQNSDVRTIRPLTGVPLFASCTAHSLRTCAWSRPRGRRSFCTPS